MQARMIRPIGRRRFLFLASAGAAPAADQAARPVVSEEACPIERVAPVAADGHRGVGFLRKPPGKGPFPAVLLVHGGLTTWPEDQLRKYCAGMPTPSRFLAAGSVVLPVTYRSRDHDPQSRVSLEDCLAAVEYLRRLPAVDPESVFVYGCSGGGDLALEVAAATGICAAVPEEPASVLFTGIFHSKFPRKGVRFTPADAAPISADPKHYYTAEYQRITRAKIAGIRCPILIIQGDQHAINRFNAEVLIPELRSAGKQLEVLTYPGEPHCFCFRGSGPQSPRPETALKAFQDIWAFCRRHAATKPRPIASRWVRPAPLGGG